MFYGQCWECGQRWELGTASTCVCPEPEPVQRRFHGYGTNPLPDTKRPPAPPPPPQRIEPVDYEKLAALGWQAVECSICGSSAQAFPKPQRKPLSEKELFKIWLSVPAETEDRFAFARAVEAAHDIKE